MELRNFKIVKPVSNVADERKGDLEPLRWTITPIRNPELDCERLDLERLEKRGVIPPVIKIGGRLVAKRQKIAILSEEEIKTIGNNSGSRIGKRPVNVQVVRVSDCPNPADEYGRPTFTVLLSFDENAEVVARNTFTQTNLAPITQSNNFLLSGTLPGSKPSPPIQEDLISATVADSDFQSSDRVDRAQYPEDAQAVVAVVDSGVKFDLANEPSQHLYAYTDRQNQSVPLQLVRGKAACGLNTEGIGYCGVTAYLGVPGSPPATVPPLLNVLTSLSRQQVASSAFDDHRLRTIYEDSAGKRSDGIGGRHGTYLTAIINQESGRVASILPVKAFNCGGYGTLFDVLSCLNYVLEQKRQGLPIYVLNASWVGSVDDEGKSLLISKFKQLEKAGIIVVAAAGNEGKDLGRNELFPARYSALLSNVITVTSVEPILKPVLRNTGSKNSTGNGSIHEDELPLLEYAAIPKSQFGLSVRGFKVVGNFSSTFVSIGVYGRRWSGFNSPFNDGQSVRGTSFAAAFVSGRIAAYLHDKGIVPTAGTMTQLKSELFATLTITENSLRQTVQEGRLLVVNS